MNTVTRSEGKKELVLVSSLKGGKLVYWKGSCSDGIFVVVRNKPNADDIAAISLLDGGFLHGSTLVTPLEAGEEVKIIAG